MTLAKKDIVQLSVTLVLAVVLVAVLISLGGRKKPAPKSAPVVESTPAPVAAAPKEKLFFRLQAEAKDLEAGRDPFVGKKTSEPSKQIAGPALNGILWDTQNPTAIVNQQIVSPGDQAAGFRVVKILPDRVVFNDGQKDFEVLINPEVSESLESDPSDLKPRGPDDAQ